MNKQTDLYALNDVALGRLADIVQAISDILTERGFEKVGKEILVVARNIRFADVRKAVEEMQDPADAIDGTDPE